MTPMTALLLEILGEEAVRFICNAAPVYDPKVKLKIIKTDEIAFLVLARGDGR